MLQISSFMKNMKSTQISYGYSIKCKSEERLLSLKTNFETNVNKL